MEQQKEHSSHTRSEGCKYGHFCFYEVQGDEDSPYISAYHKRSNLFNPDGGKQEFKNTKMELFQL